SGVKSRTSSFPSLDGPAPAAQLWRVRCFLGGRFAAVFTFTYQSIDFLLFKEASTATISEVTEYAPTREFDDARCRDAESSASVAGREEAECRTRRSRSRFRWRRSSYQVRGER